MRPVGVVGTRSSLSRPGQPVANRLVSNKNGDTQQAHSGPRQSALSGTGEGALSTVENAPTRQKPRQAPLKPTKLYEKARVYTVVPEPATP